MELVSHNVRTEIVGKVTIELTPQELASIVAAYGNSSDSECRSSRKVVAANTKNISSSVLYDRLTSAYDSVFEGRQ